MSDRMLTCNPSEHLDDWYLIEWEEHDDRSGILWGKRSGTYWSSARPSDADIEGTAEHMRGIADGIESGEGFEDRRCAAWREDDGWHLCSPRNSQRDAVVSEAVALDLVAKIRAALANTPTPEAP